MPMEMRVKFVPLAVTLMIAMTVADAGCQSRASSALNDPRAAAFALEQQGETSEAEAAWRAIAKVHPSDAEAYAHLGFLESHQEHYKQAVPLYRKALTLNPEMPGLQMNLGLALFKDGELREAIATFTPLLKNEPASSPEALRIATLIGIGHYGLGEFAAAVPDLKEAAASDPQNLSFRLMLAQSCLASKQYPCVLDVYHEILVLNAESAEADMLAGEALDETK